MKITINGKEYESGKITRKKYEKYSAVYNRLMKKDEKNAAYTGKDLDDMVQAVTDVFGGQFTFEEAVECDEMQSVAEIVLAFSAVNAEVLSEMNEIANERYKQVNQGKNLKAVPMRR